MSRINTAMLAAAVACGGVAGEAHATVATSVTPSTATSPGGLTSPLAGVTTITFDGSSAVPPQFTGGAVISGTSANQFAAPHGDTSNYFVVGAPPGYTGTATFSTGSEHDFFGLYWGSIDAFNSIAFSLNGVNVGAYTGADFPPSNGNQSAADTNEFVSFTFSPGTGYDTVTFTTTQANFELDNVSYANDIPEPASLTLLGAGLAGVAWRTRRRKLTSSLS